MEYEGDGWCDISGGGFFFVVVPEDGCWLFWYRRWLWATKRPGLDGRYVFIITRLLTRIYSPCNQDLHNHVITQTAQAFVTTFLNRCVRAHIEHMQDDSISVPPLEPSRVLPRYKHSRKRLILVDFEGTLWIRDLSRDGLVGMAKGEYVFPEEVVNVLGKLAEDSRNEVWLLSGLRVDGVLEKFREKVPKVGIMYVFF